MQVDERFTLVLSSWVFAAIAAALVADEVFRMARPSEQVSQATGADNHRPSSGALRVLSGLRYVLLFVCWTIGLLLLAAMVALAFNMRLTDSVNLEGEDKALFIVVSPWPLYFLLPAALLGGLIPKWWQKLLLIAFAATLLVGLNTLAWGFGHTTRSV